MKITPRSIARLALIGGVAAGVVAPGVAGATGNLNGCPGKVIEATANHQTLYGTPCADLILVRQFSNVWVYAGDGNDTVHAGFIGNPGKNYFYLEGGNDRVIQINDKGVWVSGGPGNDTVEGSSYYDAFHGGPGTDTFIGAMPGDFYDTVEIFG